MQDADNDPKTPSANIAWRYFAFALGTAIVLASTFSFMVQDNERALVTRFGKPVRTSENAGWHAKLPWPIEQVKRVDARLRYGEIRLSETLTRDKRNIIVPMYYAWRVEDPLRFLQSLNDPDRAEEKLDAIITSARNSALGQLDYADLFESENTTAGIAAVEDQILAQTAHEARDLFGIAIEGVGALQINLPEANTESVFRRMRAERKREASRYRAEGKSESEQIRATADNQARVLLAEAKRYAEEKRGAAEAEAAAIYAKAHEQDADLYVFLRQLQSLRAVVDKNTTLILDTNTAPFNLLKLQSHANNSALNALRNPQATPPGEKREAAPAAAFALENENRANPYAN